jgi:hypothetical protein
VQRRPKGLEAIYEAGDYSCIALTTAHLLDWMIKSKLGGIHLINIWVGWRISPLKHHMSLLCSYTGIDDVSRTTCKDWREGEALALMKRLTSLAWCSFDDLPHAFLAANPAPHVCCYSSLFMSPEPYSLTFMLYHTDLQIMWELPPLPSELPDITCANYRSDGTG